jgi:hypothetical protein
MGSARASSNLVVVVVLFGCCWSGGRIKKLTTNTISSVRVAQWIARLPPKEKVVGSTPTSDMLPFFLVATPIGLTSLNNQRLGGRHQKWNQNFVV